MSQKADGVREALKPGQEGLIVYFFKGILNDDVLDAKLDKC